MEFRELTIKADSTSIDVLARRFARLARFPWGSVFGSAETEQYKSFEVYHRDVVRADPELYDISNKPDICVMEKSPDYYLVLYSERVSDCVAKKFASFFANFIKN